MRASAGLHGSRLDDRKRLALSKRRIEQALHREGFSKTESMRAVASVWPARLAKIAPALFLRLARKAAAQHRVKDKGGPRE
jgi:hypothetical protein